MQTYFKYSHYDFLITWADHNPKILSFWASRNEKAPPSKFYDPFYFLGIFNKTFEDYRLESMPWHIRRGYERLKTMVRRLEQVRTQCYDALMRQPNYPEKIERNIEIVDLKDKEGMSIREIGEAKKLTASTVHQIYHRTKKKLADGSIKRVIHSKKKKAIASVRT